MNMTRFLGTAIFFGLALGACSSDGSRESADTDSDNETDSSSSTPQDTLSGSDSSTSDTGTGSGTQDTGSGSATQETDTTPDTVTQPDTNPVEQCDTPSGFLTAPSTESYFIFNASGHLNDISDTTPLAASAFIDAQYKGETVDFSSGSTVAYYSASGQRAYFKMRSAADEEGHFYYAEAKISVFDLMTLDSAGEHLLDLYDAETQTTTRFYEGWQDSAGNIDKLCLLGVPWENAFYYACTTGIDYMTNVGEPFSMAGNIEIFDDTEYLSHTEYAMCLCDNGAGSWRSCDPGIPDDYGRLRFSFRDGATENDYFSKYVYDESKLWTGGNIDTAYVGAHESGMWRHTYSFMTGGLNIMTSSDDLGDFIYGFGEPIPYGSGVIGLVSHDMSSGLIIVRQQSFETLDAGADPVGLWLIAYVPDDVQQGDLVEFGTGEGTAKLFAYDANDPSQCIQAIACNTSARVQRATNLMAAEGGTFELRTENDENGSRMSLRLVYPGEDPNCDIETYVTEVDLPGDSAICDKL